MTQQYLFQDYVEAWRARREQERDHDAPPRRWYRFTLCKMVVAFVLLGAAFAYLRNTHWGYLAGERISDVGRRFGLVERPDNSKIRVNAVRPFGHLDFEWRISIPQGHDYEIDVMYVEGRRHVVNLPVSRESLVSFSTRISAGTPDLIYRLEDASGMLPKKLRSTIYWVPGLTSENYEYTDVSGVLWGDAEQTCSPGEKVLLYQANIKLTKRDGRIDNSLMPIAIWLRPMKP